MKYVDQMTEAELCALSEKEIEQCIALQCAEEGVPLALADLGEPPTPPVVNGDCTIYQVGSWMFTSEADAQAVCDVVARCPVWDIDSRYKHDGPFENLCKSKKSGSATITVRSGVSPLRDAEAGQAAADFLASKTAYDERLEARQEHAERRAEIAKAVRVVVDAARAREAQREHWAGIAQQYLELADGDRVVARRFFEKAYPGVLEQNAWIVDLHFVVESAPAGPPPRF